jgi:tetratricopeptide (TPR) repeat protein
VADALDAGYYNTQGLDLYRTGDYADAVEKFERAYSLEPDNETIQSNLVNAHLAAAKQFVEANDLDAAISELGAALELKDDDPTLYVYTASLCLSTGDLPSAEDRLLSAVDIDPEHKDAHMLLGEVYYRDGSLEDAIEQWRRVNDLDPFDETLVELLAKAERELEVEKDFVTEYKRRHFIINRDRDNFEEESRTILDILERAYYDIGRDLQHWPRNPVRVILYSTEQFSIATLANCHIAGLYDGKIRVPLSSDGFDEDKLKQVLRHEYTHVIVRELTGGKIPFWFNEGLAQFESEQLDRDKRRILENALENGELIPLEDLDETQIDLDTDPGRLHLAYLEGFATVSYLRRRFTRYRLFSFMDLLGQGYDTETALKQTYGRSYKQLHREVFREYR